MTHEPADICINAIPGCIINPKPIFHNGALEGFDVSRQCDPSEEVTYLGRASLGNQIKDDNLYGNKLCNETLSNTVLKHSLFANFRHNTDYSVKLSEEDRYEVTYRRLLSNPNRP